MINFKSFQPVVREASPEDRGKSKLNEGYRHFQAVPLDLSASSSSDLNLDHMFDGLCLTRCLLQVVVKGNSGSQMCTSMVERHAGTSSIAWHLRYVVQKRRTKRKA